jgi:asparagine synthase (glutamine-hydrolysing)
MVQQAAHSRVVLTGWDGDMLLNESPKPYFRWLLRKGRWARLAAGVGGYAVSERRLLPRRGLSEAQQAQDSYPAWLDREFEARLSLPDRWRAVNAKPAATHAIRPYAHRVLSWLGQWSNFFDFYDAGATRLPLEARHPFLDLRVVELCLTLPPYPWCIRKEILRRSLTGVLPDEVRMRPKTALGGSPAMALLSRADTRWNRFVATPGLERYVDPKRVPRVWHAERAQAAWIDLRPVSLGSWLRTHAFDAMTGEPA